VDNCSKTHVGLDHGVGHFRPRSMPAASASAPGLRGCGAWASHRGRGKGRRSDRGPFAYTQRGARAMLGTTQHELGYVTREPLARASRLLSRPHREIAP
jgi:hypothetical protein